MGIFALAVVEGQDHEDAVRPFWGLGGPGSRPAALGQAFTAIADDATALYYNPAGLAQIVRPELNMGLYHLVVTSKPGDPLEGSNSAISATRIGNLGLAFPLDRRFTAGLGYHAVRAFESHRLGRFTIPHQRGPSGEYSEEITESGSLDLLSLGVGFAYSPELAVGMGVHYLWGRNRYEERTELIPDQSPSSTGASDFIMIAPEYSGLGLSLGLLYRPVPDLRIGFHLRLPVRLHVEESFTDSSGKQSFDYALRGPFELSQGVAFTWGPVLLTGEASWRDFSQIRFESDLVTYQSDTTFTPIDPEINRTLRSEYASASVYVLGAEVLLPVVDAKLRAAFRYESPPWKGASEKYGRTTVAAGFSVVPVKKVKLDFAYTQTSWREDSYLTLPGGGEIDFEERVVAGQAAMNISLRF